MQRLHCLNQISVCFLPVSMVSSHEVCLFPVCLDWETSGPRVPGEDHLDQRQDHSDRRHPHRWQAWDPGWVRAGFTTSYVKSSRGTTYLCFLCRCGAQSVLGACPVHCLPQQAPAAKYIPKTPSVLGRRLEGPSGEQTAVKQHHISPRAQYHSVKTFDYWQACEKRECFYIYNCETDSIFHAYLFYCLICFYWGLEIHSLHQA